MLNTLRIQGVNVEPENIIEGGPLADPELFPKMVCGRCAERISTALSAVPSIREVAPNVVHKHVFIA